MDQKISDLDIKIAMEATDIIPVVDSNGENKAINGAQVKDFVGLEVAQDIDDVKAMISDEYDPERVTPYEAGDLVIYNNTLYKCLDTTSGAWDDTKWDDTTIETEINELKSGKQDSLSNSDIPITVLSQSVGDVTLKCTKYGNIACLTGYFRTTASISANSSIFSGFPNPVVNSSDNNLYFIFQNETDDTLIRFRINRNYCEFKKSQIKKKDNRPSLAKFAVIF